MPASRVVGGRLRMRLPSLANVRITSKLVLILVVPIVAILALTVLRLTDARDRATDAQLVGELTSLSAEASRVAHEIHHERMDAATFLADPAASNETYTTQIEKTDEAVTAYTTKRDQLDSLPTNVSDRLESVDAQLATLTEIRESVTARSGISIAEATLRYGLTIDDLVSFQESLSQVTSDQDMADALTAAAAFARAKAMIGSEEAVVYPALVSTGSLDDQQYASFISTLTAQQEAFVAFELSASTEQSEVVESAVAGDAVQVADDISTSLASTGSNTAATTTAASATSALSAVNDLMRYTQDQLDEDLITQANVINDDVRREVIIETSVILAVLLIALVLALGTARSMAKTLQRLRNGALAIADYELAEAVNKLKDAQIVDEQTPEQIANEVVDSIGINTRDEVGEVAKAFHIVHKEAVRIAAEQAVLRASISAMFLNLARRSQTLVDRMIGQLDTIERGEEDSKRLAQLFRLDHLATRMRRNDENVLVLAGADSTPPRKEDAPLFDIIRAAQSEVEQYERIEFGTIDDDVSVAARAVNDVVRLLAELLDNATRLSPPSESVTVEARRVGDRVHLQIEDRGIGMDSAAVKAHNARFAAPPVIDVTTFRMMGLAVVGRLAFRHGIGVQLRENPGGGLTAELMFPSEALILPPVWVRQEAGMRPLAAAPSPPPPAPAAIADSPTAPFSTLGPATTQRTPSGGLPTRSWNIGQPSVESSEAPTAGRRPQPVETSTGQQPAARPPATWPATSADVPPAARPTSPPQPQRPAPVVGQRPPAAVPPVAAPRIPAQQPAPTQQPAPVQPVAAAGAPATTTAGAPPENSGAPADPTELPIYREIEAAWFRAHGNTQGISVYTPAASPPPGPAPAPAAPAPASSASWSSAPTAAVAGATTELPTRPVPTPAPTDSPEIDDPWRTRADEGWRRAAAAAAPSVDKKTRTGLPKRNPGAQLVPGSVEAKTTARTRRTPDQVRGLLSTYQRGVQRGRSATSEADSGTPGTAEGSGQ